MTFFIIIIIIKCVVNSRLEKLQQVFLKREII